MGRGREEGDREEQKEREERKRGKIKQALHRAGFRQVAHRYPGISFQALELLPVCGWI